MISGKVHSERISQEAPDWAELLKRIDLYIAGFAFYSRHELEWHDFIAYGSSLV